jgi:hypothetical protein
MSKRLKAILLLLASLLLLMPFGIYVVHFWGTSLSFDTEKWGQFGDYLNGTFMPLIALIGIIVTLLLGIISENRNSTKLRIDQEKQRPLLHVGYFDSEDEIKIFQKNKGNGPLIITNYRLVNIISGEIISGFFDCIPPMTDGYDNYTGNQNNTVLSAGEETVLLCYSSSSKNNFQSNADSIRLKISKFKVVVDYKDVFDNDMPTYERSLEWFGRQKY